MRIPNFIRTGSGVKHRTQDSYNLISEPEEIRIMNLHPNPQPYATLYGKVITISFVSKAQDPDTQRETIMNHTFFLPLSHVTNYFIEKLRMHEGKPGVVNV